MANPLRKGWRYLSTKLSAGIDERADPRIQIQQAIEDAQQQHHRLIQQAAAVIGQQRQLQMRLSRQLEHVEQLQASARQALLLADSARSSGDERKAVEYEQAGQSFASQLVAAERAIEDLKALYDQAVLAATEARRAVEQNAMLLQHKLAERTRLLTQLEQAKLQEQVADSLQQMSDTAIPTATPSLAEVRDKIEARYARALGQAELARSTMSGRMLEVESAAMDMAGAARLAEIRASITSSLPRAAEAIEAPDSKT